jgi:hypothetical protein
LGLPFVVGDGWLELGLALEPGEVLAGEVGDRGLFVERVPDVGAALP